LFLLRMFLAHLQLPYMYFEIERLQSNQGFLIKSRAGGLYV
jgi:hypothetical protein